MSNIVDINLCSSIILSIN